MLFRFFVPILAISVMVGPSAAADEPSKFAGTWKAREKFADYDLRTTIGIDGGALSIKGTLEKDGTVAGTFAGENVRHAGGSLTFLFRFVKKPEGTWLDHETTLRLEGDALVMSWVAKNGKEIVRLCERVHGVPADESSKFVGTWKTKVKFAGYDQTIAIIFDRGKWSVTGTFQRDDAVVGTFFGESPRFAGGRLTYRSKYVKKPDESWGEDNATLRLDGEALIMSFPAAGGGDIVRAFARTADDPKPMPHSKFVGTWKGSLAGYDELWTVKNNDGAWSINGKLLFNGAEYGSFIGSDVKELNGTLTFTRKFVKTPPRNPNLVDEVAIIVKAQGENLSYTWSGADKKGSGALEKIAAVGEKPAPDDDKSKAIIGQWYHETNGMDVAWVVGKNADGTWFVRGQYIKPKTKIILGGFEGKDIKYEDGKLIFTRVWLRKPNTTSRDLGHVTIRSIGNDQIHLAIKERDGSTYNKDCPRLPGTQ